ncbi:MAG: type II toxin-antitoxin system YafQ family toxin [Pseudobutyrivibrio ruminis]|uniref:Type II toxin-antitoxin system YafQ family toxin n=1 Tax=Pseudobutyrivibrio ruminis TaxID=46206 RepID=A0A927YNL5_9FIRM|nr:type II toxin-antitoxin system YafQ family toxin [Pseudobutyrivibrio ruminis]
MKYKIVITTKFKKDYKKCKKRGYDLELLQNVLNTLSAGEKLDSKYYDHPLHGNYEGFNECHIMSDWLLIYAINNDTLILTASRTGTHSDLFDE